MVGENLEWPDSTWLPTIKKIQMTSLYYVLLTVIYSYKDKKNIKRKEIRTLIITFQL